MKYPENILICGIGSIGKYYVQLIKKNWPFIKVSILRSGKGASFKETELADHIFFNSSDALNSKPNACIISSPASCHLEHALYFANSGIPLLIEKPVGTLEEDPELWKQLIKLNIKVPIFVGYVLRSDPCANHIKTLLSSQQIGRLIEADFFCGSWLPEWRESIDYRESVSASKDLGGGALLELSHEIDLALWLLGEIKVHSSLLTNTGILGIEVEEQALVTGFNDYCPSISFRLNFCTKPSRRVTTIRGDSGEIIWDLYKRNIICNKEKGFSESKQFKLSKDELFTLQLIEFFKGIKNKNSLLCNLYEGLSVLKLIKESKQMYSKEQ